MSQVENSWDRSEPDNHTHVTYFFPMYPWDGWVLYARYNTARKTYTLTSYPGPQFLSLSFSHKPTIVYGYARLARIHESSLIVAVSSFILSSSRGCVIKTMFSNNFLSITTNCLSLGTLFIVQVYC